MADPAFEPASAAELTELVKNVRIADPNVDNGAFESMNLVDVFKWMKMLDLNMSATAREETGKTAKDKLRRALWDVQRIDNNFPGVTFSTPSKPTLNIDALKTWVDWKKPRPELNTPQRGMQLDAFKDEQRLNS